MEIVMQQELKDACLIKRWLPSDMLEVYLECASLYSKQYWLSLQDEYLRRMDLELVIL